MQIFERKEQLQNYLNLNRANDVSIGFVPTMGALHKGHLSLVNKSIKENDLTVVSIFVNPTQFNNKEDFEKYPNLLEKDIALLKKINCDVVFTPSVSEMYGEYKTSESFNFGGIENEMEGAFRRGHFDGVGTIVKRLFDIVNPNKAYFGEKDFQQLQVIKKLVELESLKIQVIGCPIERESNGLAMSSRNERLTKQQKEDAGFIFQTLSKVKKNYSVSHEKQQEWVYNQFKNHPSLKLEYFLIADEQTLKPINERNNNKKPRAFIAVFLNSVRLIDNLALYT